MRSLPMYACHAVALIGPFLVPFSWRLVWLAAALYAVRMFGLTAGYHRYFAHRSYKTSRPFQFVLAWLGCTCAAEGAAVVGRAPPRTTTATPTASRTSHSPISTAFWWSHVGWILSEAPRRPATIASATWPASPSCAGWTATTGCHRWRWPCLLR